MDTTRSLRMQLRVPHTPLEERSRSAPSSFMAAAAAAPASRVIGSKPWDCFLFQDPNTWTCITELASDVVVQVGETSFHLHKAQLISRSGTLNKLVNECAATDGGSEGGDDDSSKPCTVVRLDDLPGGAEAFLLAARFCYDVQTELDAGNVVPLRCAAEHLAMTGEGNLAEQAEAFLSEVLAGWSDTVRALDSCGSDGDGDAGGVRAAAEGLRIVARCIDSLADKACAADPTLAGWPMPEYFTAKRKSLEETTAATWNGIGDDAGRPPRSPGAEEWWYETASAFGLPLYKRLIAAVRSRGMSPEHVAGSLVHYARRHLSGLRRLGDTGADGSSRGGGGGGARASGAKTAAGEQRALLEEIVALLPVEKGAAPTRFLLGLLRVATVLRAAAACRDALERRAGGQLEEAALEDLLIPSTGYSAETLYDVDSFQRMLEQFMATTPPAFAASPETTTDEAGQLVDAELMPVSAVAKLVDGYLAEVGTDPDLKPGKFQTIAALVPDYARAIDDGLYRAIDIYLKAHPWLTDSEREQLCRLMNCQKLSLEACTHAAQNERLPLRVVVQVLFFEQLRLRTTLAGWFFVSDNADRASSSDNCVLPRRRPDDDLGFEAAGSEVATDEDGEPSSPAMSVPEIVPEEVHRPRKPKSALSRLLGKLGICGRSSPSPLPQHQQPPPVASDKRRKSFRL